MNIKELVEQALESGQRDYWLERFAALVAAHEREACAKLCESHVRQPSRLHFAAAIRARGTT
jgi:hypothetical protein